MELGRRKFLGLLAAPAILRATKPMALWTPKPDKIIIGWDVAQEEDWTAWQVSGELVGRITRISLPTVSWQATVINHLNETIEIEASQYAPT